MIVGHCVWGKTDEDPDIMKIYRVYDAPGFGPMILDEPVCVLEEAIDQKLLNSISFSMDEKRAIDEIRIGTTSHSVLMGTKPMP